MRLQPIKWTQCAAPNYKSGQGKKIAQPRVSVAKGAPKRRKAHPLWTLFDAQRLPNGAQDAHMGAHSPPGGPQRCQIDTDFNLQVEGSNLKVASGTLLNSKGTQNRAKYELESKMYAKCWPRCAQMYAKCWPRRRPQGPCRNILIRCMAPETQLRTEEPER